MTPAALDVYDLGLESQSLELVLRDGSSRRLPVERWLSPARGADREVLERCRGPVLDIGCGPGRHVHALAAQGELALGVDISPAAVRLARTRGAAALEASVFDRLPGAGLWRTALLLDGNIGIGACPSLLLRRVAALLAPGGRVIVETESAPATALETFDGRLRDSSGAISGWIRWTRVGGDALAEIAAAEGFSEVARFEVEGRWFAELVSRSRRAGRSGCAA